MKKLYLLNFNDATLPGTPIGTIIGGVVKVVKGRTTAAENFYSQIDVGKTIDGITAQIPAVTSLNANEGVIFAAFQLFGSAKEIIIKKNFDAAVNIVMYVFKRDALAKQTEMLDPKSPTDTNNSKTDEGRVLYFNFDETSTDLVAKRIEFAATAKTTRPDNLEETINLRKLTIEGESFVFMAMEATAALNNDPDQILEVSVDVIPNFKSDYNYNVEGQLLG
jgi:hypothetical protein